MDKPVDRMNAAPQVQASGIFLSRLEMNGNQGSFAVKKTLTVLVSVAALSVGALGAGVTPALAHHSANAEFDTSKTAQVTGVLTELKDINPHSYWSAVVKTADGKAENWQFQGVSPTVLRRQGVKVKEQIKPGGTYTFIYAPSWTNPTLGLLVAMVIDGKRYQYINI